MYVLSNDVLASFTDINRAIQKLLKKDAESIGITVVQLKALYWISFNPNISLGDLAEKLKLTNSTVSGVIDRLVLNGYVERVIPPENRRAISLHLTEEGQELLQKLFTSDSIFVKRVNELLELPKEDIETLLRLHKQILEKLETEEDELE